MNAKNVSAALAQQVHKVAPFLLRNGKPFGNYWRAGDLHGAAGKSLWLHMSGPMCGRWKDGATDESGDLLNLIALQNGVSLKEAMQIAMELLGNPDLSTVEPQRQQKAKNIFGKTSLFCAE